MTAGRRRPPRACSGSPPGPCPTRRDMRPSVTSATRWPRSSSTPSAGVSLCSSGIPFARGPWWRMTATWSWSSSPRSKASRKSRWSSKTRAGAVTTRCSGATARDLHHRAAERAVEHADAAVGGEGVAHAGRSTSRRGLSRGAGRQAQLARLVEERLVAVAAEAVARDGVDVRVHQAGVEQLADQERRRRPRRGSG